MSGTLDRALRTSFGLCAGCGWLAGSLVLLDHAYPESSPILLVLTLAWLVFAPLYEAELRALVARLPWIGRRLSRWAVVLEILPVAFLPVPWTESLLFGAVVLAQGHLFLSCSDDDGGARCLAAAPIASVVALAYSPSLPLLILAPASALASVVTLVLMNARRSRRQVRRAQPAAEPASRVFWRLGYGGALAAILIVATMALFPWLVPETTVPLPGPISHTPSPDGGVDNGFLPDSSGNGDGDAGEIDPTLAFGGDNTLPFSDEEVFSLYPEQGAPAGGTVHLRDMVMDTFTPSTVRLGDRRTPPKLTDLNDGRDDGWTRAASAPRNSRYRHYRIEGRRLYLSASHRWTLLFSPHPLADISLESIHYHPDRVLYTTEPVPEVFSYRLRCLDRDTSPARLATLSCDHSLPRRYWQLPADSPAMDTIRSLAEEWTRDARTDFQIVASVLYHLRTEFTYELKQLDFRGPEAMVEFLEERKGYCTYFASAATMMLRARGLPARVATGFNATEWVEEEGRWIVRERDAHAWIEVAFEDVGWVNFEATPAGARDEILAAEAPDLAEDELVVEDGTRAALGAWLEGEGSLGEIAKSIWRSIWAALDRLPWLWMIPSALVFVILHLIFSNRRDNGTAMGPRAVAPPARFDPLWAEFLSALVRHDPGDPGGRRRGRTPRERASSLRADSPQVEQAVESYYRARFGDAPLDPSERELIQGAIDGLSTSQDPS